MEIAGESNPSDAGACEQIYRVTLQMNNGEVAPVVAQIFGDESAVTVFRRRLTAQQHGGNGEQTTVDAFFDAPFTHQVEKASLIRLPTPSLLFVFVEQFLCRGEQRLMLIVCATDHAQKVREVVALGESSQLRGVIQADV